MPTVILTPPSPIIQGMATPLDPSRNLPPAQSVAAAGNQQTARSLPSAFQISLALGLSAILAAFIAYTVACLRFASLGADQSWLLYAAGRVLDGFTLDGPRIVESNPPLIVWFSALPDLLARSLHSSPLFVLKIMVTAMTFASAAWSVRILRTAKLGTTPLLLSLSFFGLTAVDVSRDFINYGQFGEREQLVILFALPYLLYSCCSHALGLRTPERIALGIAAGLGVCFKPQQVLILIAFELFFLLYTRNLRRLLRPELLAATLAVCAYVLIVVFTTPYFRTIVPILRDTYWAFTNTTKSNLAHIAFLNGKFLLALVLAIATRRYLKFPAAPLALLAAGFGAGLAYMQQGMAWDYHLLPAIVLYVCATGWIALDLLSGLLASVTDLTPRRNFALAALTLLLFAISLPRFFTRERLQDDLAAKYRGPLFRLVHQFPAQTSFYVFSTSNGEFFQEVIEDHLVWASRYNHLWMLPAIAESERAFAGGPAARKSLTPSRVNELSTKLRTEIAEDLRTNNPQIVVVEHCDEVAGCQGIHHYDFAMLPWFLESPVFAAQWSHYQLQSAGPYFDIYTPKAIPPTPQ